MTGETLSGRYLIERKLGSGGAAEVLLAADTILHRQVAIKRLHGWLSADREARVRFQQEAQAFARLTHPHIVALFDVGEDNNRPYLVMEYLEGETLRTIISHEGPFHPDDIAVVIEHIGEALDFAHRRGVIHRDIKPENVLVDRNGVVKVVDFGIAKVLEDATITQAGLAPGTAQYISPEQAQGHPVTAASDIYSLGVIAYEMLAGRPPFTGDSAVAVATQHVNEAARSPSDINREAPRAASDIVLRAMAKRPLDRYPSAGEFAQAMLRWDDQPTVAIPTVAIPTAAVADPLATVRIPTREIEPQPPSPPRPEPAQRGLGRAGLGAAALLALVAIGSILWLLLDRGDARTGGPTATAGTLAVSGDATRQPTLVPTVPVVVPTLAVVARTAPALVGTLLADAEVIDGIEIVSEQRADPAEVGTILEQEPSDGEPVTDGVIRVIVSSGATPLVLEDLDLIDRPSDEVFDELITAGFNVSRNDVPGGPEIPEGQVVAFSPSDAAPGETVTVDVSMGNRFQIPIDLQSQPLDAATLRLEDMGFVMGPPIAVSRTRIVEVLPEGTPFPFEDGDVVGIQEESVVVGEWVSSGTTVTLVYYDASIDG